MTIHRAADVYLGKTAALRDATPFVTPLLYHMLRVMGWDRIWECDGDRGWTTPPTHIDDANMEDSGVTNWTAVSAGVPTKITDAREGNQALRITASSSSGTGVRTNALLSVTASVQYTIMLWARNASGKTWTVEADDGGGVFSSAGTIPDNSGVWTRYEYTFTTDGGAGARYIRIVCNDTPVGGEYVDIDWVITFRSSWENPGTAVVRTGTDGELDNSDEFSSGGYTLQGSDVGKFLFVRDLVNPKNTGCYEILSVAAGVGTLNMRGSRTFTTNTTGNLTWRIVDITNGGFELQAAPIQWSGFALESPHSSKQRLVVRATNRSGTFSQHLFMWAAPNDTDLDVETGDFYQDGKGPSTQQMTGLTGGDISSEAGKYTLRCGWFVSNPYGRNFMLIDEDGAFFLLAHVPDTPSSSSNGFIMGYPGADQYHPGVQEWVWFAVLDNVNDTNHLFFNNSNNSWVYRGLSFDANKKAVQTMMTTVPIYSAIANPNWATNAQDNPLTSEGVYLRPRIIRDVRRRGLAPNIRVCSDLGLLMGRAQGISKTSTRDNDTKLHLNDGTYLDWDGESIAP